MENSEQSLHSSGSMLNQKTNEDYNKKLPDPKDPNEKKSDTNIPVSDDGETTTTKENPITGHEH